MTKPRSTLPVAEREPTDLGLLLTLLLPGPVVSA